MKVIGRLGRLEAFGEKHGDVRSQLDHWLAEMEEAKWQNHNELKERYRSASLLKDRRVVFDLKGGKYRLLVRIDYRRQLIRIENIGTHKEYDRWKL